MGKLHGLFPPHQGKEEHDETPSDQMIAEGAGRKRSQLAKFLLYSVKEHIVTSCKLDLLRARGPQGGWGEVRETLLERGTSRPEINIQIAWEIFPTTC